MSLGEPLLNFGPFPAILLIPGARAGLLLVTKLHLWLRWLEGDDKGLKSACLSTVPDGQQVKERSCPPCVMLRHYVRGRCFMPSSGASSAGY